MSEFRCPVCGASLPAPNHPCPFCAEAQRLLQQLMEKDEVHLCARCGVLLEDTEDDLCPTCRKVAAARPSPLRREDRVAGWLRDRFVEPVAERQGLVCPSCHAALPPLALFCSHCGYKLVGAGEAAAPSPEPVEVASDLDEVTEDEAPPTSSLVPADLVEGHSTVAEPSWWQQTLDFWRDQFRPRDPVPEQPGGSWYEQVWRWLRTMFGSKSGGEGSGIWLWILLGLLLVAVAAMAVFWATLLRSGDFVFH